MNKNDILHREVKELTEISEDFDRLVEHKPYSPNRAQRRAMSKRDRALQKRNPRG